MFICRNYFYRNGEPYAEQTFDRTWERAFHETPHNSDAAESQIRKIYPRGTEQESGEGQIGEGKKLAEGKEGC